MTSQTKNAALIYLVLETYKMYDLSNEYHRFYNKVRVLETYKMYDFSNG